MKGMITPENLQWFEPFLTRTAARLIRENAPVYAVGAVEEKTGTACGALVGYVKGGCFHLISLFVSPEYRRNGYGNLLLGELVEDCRKSGTGILVSFSESGEETEALKEFLEYWLFDREENGDGEIYEIILEEARRSKYYTGRSSAMVHRLDSCQERWLREIGRKAYEAGAPMPEGGFSADSIEREISVVYVRDNKPTAYLIFDHSMGGKLTLSALYSYDRSPYAMAEMLNASMELCGRKYPGETRFYMQAINKTSENLIEKVFPDARKISQTYYLKARV